MKKKIVLVSGDPNSINSEIIFKCWKNLSKKYKKNICIVSNYNLLKDQFKKLNYKVDLIKVNSLDDLKSSEKLKIIDVKIKYDNPFKVSKKNASKFIIDSFNLAHQLALNPKVAGLINCPIDKNLLNKKQIGITEFLASKCSLKKNSEVMVILGKNLIVSPLTTHIDLKLIPKKINKKLIIDKITKLNFWFKKAKGRKPKIAVLGLNPHNSEFRKESEERKIIIPAVKKLKHLGITLSGPISADTMFINEYKNYDIIVGMYHDQVLTPFKTLFKFDAINITLGLKYVRVSPDHGVAVNRILKKNSDPTSLLRCFDFIINAIK